MICKPKLKILLSLICSGWRSTLSQVPIPQVPRRGHYTLSTHRAVSHTVPAKDKKSWLPPKEPQKDSLTSPSVVRNSASSYLHPPHPIPGPPPPENKQSQCSFHFVFMSLLTFVIDT